jgi:hypothetical protein
MNTKQLNKLTMFLAVEGICDTAASHASPTPPTPPPAPQAK